MLPEDSILIWPAHSQLERLHQRSLTGMMLSQAYLVASGMRGSFICSSDMSRKIK